MESNLVLTHGSKQREAAKTRRQRNMTQMKEQIETPKKDKEMEVSILSNAESKTLVIRMLKELSEKLRKKRRGKHPHNL